MDPRMFMGGGSPFGGGGSPFGGGHPGMRGGRGKPADTQGLYDILGVKKDDDTKTIKKAFRKLAIKNHPDKGGDPEVFQKISEAWEILGNEKKRNLYDKRGKEGVQQATEQGGLREKFGPNTETTIKVTLEQLYKGNARKLRVRRTVIDKDSKVNCRRCGGRGVVIQRVQMMGMIQQMQSHCDHCGGQGHSFRSSQKSETLDVQIPKGAKNGFKQKFSEMANEIPDGTAGDIIVMVAEQPHGTFQRKGDDLFITRTISLSDALCGFSTEVKTLDGRTLIIKSRPGDVLRPTTFDPFAEAPEGTWEEFADTDVEGLQDLAKGQLADVDKIKSVLAAGGQLHGKGVGAFVIRRGNVIFKKCDRTEAVAAQVPRNGSTLYVVGDPSQGGSGRAMKAVAGEGMPRGANPFENGNLFISFEIEFPEAGALDEAARAALLKCVPKKCKALSKENDKGVEVVSLTDVDPVASFENNKPAESDEEDEEGGRGGGGQAQECCVM